MERGLTITALGPDEDYLGIELVASNERFAGSAYIYAGVDELSEFGELSVSLRRHDRGPKKPGAVYAEPACR
jgi:hypothetical protein